MDLNIVKTTVRLVMSDLNGLLPTFSSFFEDILIMSLFLVVASEGWWWLRGSGENGTRFVNGNCVRTSSAHTCEMVVLFSWGIICYIVVLHYVNVFLSNPRWLHIPSLDVTTTNTITN